ncbi:serine hydrolase domain-containing protein [Caulobacter mirabilis]|uniref:Beta-lactamase-related domain-containing protein n=1 Tax=Caulobacter mirabilis TaxID=69666 RepID=A0A2D2AUG7_9CAUL|nr:serine hydrolase domain-containing protein [Caulobacter mirabilis]ATQ41648.1 hypothetical protein CSW64_04075 [Caulobacter mirabilis]
MKRVSPLLLSLAIALQVGVSSSLAAVPAFSRLDAEMTVRCADGRFSGVVMVAVKGVPAYSRSCGEGVTPASRFKIFSISKLLTALAVMRLVEQGRMGLDAPAAAYIPDLPAAWRAVTIRQLLDHTSGLPDKTEALLAVFETDHAAAMRRVLADLGQDAPGPETPPGATYRYNNFGYELLAEAAARVEGESFDRVLERLVLKPAGMADAVVELAIPAPGGGRPSSVPDDRLAPGFNRSEAGRTPATSYSFVQLGAGAVHATVADFLALDRALRGGALVRPETWDLMARSSRPSSPANPTARYGLGVMSIEREGLTLQGHTGGTNGYISTFRRLPASDAMLAAMSNYGWTETKWIEEAVAAELRADGM